MILPSFVSAIAQFSHSIVHLCFDDLTQNLPNESDSVRQTRDDGSSAPSPAVPAAPSPEPLPLSPALPSPDKNELKSRLKAAEALAQAQSLENSALKKENASLMSQAADMRTRFDTLETELQTERDSAALERKQGRNRLREHREASSQAAAKKEVSRLCVNEPNPLTLSQIFCRCAITRKNSINK